MKKIRVNSVYSSVPNDYKSIAAIEKKDVIIIEFIDDENNHLFGSRILDKTKNKIVEALSKKMLKLPFGIRLFY